MSARVASECTWLWLALRSNRRCFATEPALPSGVSKELITAGDGALVESGQNVTVHCTGYGKNGDLQVPFWSTKDPGQGPFTFRVGQGEVITAWDTGVLTMRVGETASILTDAANGCIFAPLHIWYTPGYL